MSNTQEQERTEIDRLTTALYEAWVVISNAYDFARWHGESGGLNKAQADDWKGAADRWRDDQFHPALKRNPSP